MTLLSTEAPARQTPADARAAAPTYPFVLPPLRFAYDALEPYIDAETMRLHHDKHHQTYVTNLNAALKDLPQFQNMTVEEVLRHLGDVPEEVRTAVRNNGGGHANHQFFWKILGPGAGAGPAGKLASAINQEFGSFAAFQSAFAAAGAKVFGSGWVFLVTDPQDSSRLKLHTTANQDSVLLEGLPGLLACDVWEHAYYLKYQNRRPDYLAAFWNVVDWEVVGQRFDGVRAGKKQL